MKIWDFAKEKFERFKREETDRMIDGREKGRFSIVFEKYLDNPATFDDVMVKLDELMCSHEYQDIFLQEHRASLSKKRKAAEEQCMEYMEKEMDCNPLLAEIDMYQKEEAKSFEEYVSDCKKALTGLQIACTRPDGENIYNRLNYKVFILDELYKIFLKQIDPYVLIDGSRFEEFYNNHDVSRIESCKANYGLMYCDDEIEIIPGKISKLYDRKNNLEILVSSFLPNSFITMLAEQKEKDTFLLSLRPNYNVCGESLKSYVPSLTEEIAFGKPFDGFLKSILKVNKFVDYTTNDQFLVYIIDENSVMFEEIVGTCGENDNENVTTQAVHIQFKDEKINHMDHEFFFYTPDEYKKKKNSVLQYGSARERYKTFKIDEANITFEQNSAENFLYRTLHIFFKNHNLIDEYFARNISA